MYDVAIVGYGPVGATFANLLARYGLKLAIVEQAAGVYDKPRAITIDHEVLRVFQACGLADFMERTTAPHPGTHYLGVDGQIIKIFDPMPPPYPLGWTPTATFVQPDLEKALRRKLDGYDKAEVFLSTTATSFEQDEECVSLIANTNSNSEHRLQARYLVGCDGANSFVRKHLDIGLEDLAFDEWWMVVDALTNDPANRPAKGFQYCWPARPGTFVPGPGALRRWEIKLLPGENPDEMGAPEKVFQLLKSFTDTSDLTIWRSAVYRFHALLAERWRTGRVFMMGDSVHQTPPFMGQGLCAGIRDAFNLAWKLAFELRGEKSAFLLDSYESERKPHVRSIVSTAKEFGKIIGELDPDAALARDARLRAELTSGQAQTNRQKFIPDLADGLIAKRAPLAGSLFVQPSIRRPGGQIMRLDDLLAPEFAIVAASRDTVSWMTPASRRIWESLQGQRVIIAPDILKEDCNNVLFLEEAGSLFSDWLNQNEIKVAIVRPDRYLFAAARNAEELNSFILELTHLIW